MRNASLHHKRGRAGQMRLQRGYGAMASLSDKQCSNLGGCFRKRQRASRMDIRDLESVKTKVRAKKAKWTIGLQPRGSIKKFRWNTVGREKAEIAAILFARVVFRHHCSEFTEILCLAQACGDLQHLTILCLC